MIAALGARLKKCVLSVLLISVLLMSGIPRVYAYGGYAGYVLQAIQVLMSLSASNAEKTQAKMQFMQSWTSTWQTSSSYRVKISIDDLYAACFDLNRSGAPCEIRNVDGIWVIRGTGYPRSVTSAGAEVPLIDGYTINGKYFVSPDNKMFYAVVGDDSAYSVYYIRTYLSNLSTFIQSTISSQLTAITNKLSALDDYLYSIDVRLQVPGYPGNFGALVKDIYDTLHVSVGGVDKSVARMLYVTMGGTEYTIAETVSIAIGQLQAISSKLDNLSFSGTVSAYNDTALLNKLDSISSNITARSNGIVSAVNAAAYDDSGLLGQLSAMDGNAAARMDLLLQSISDSVYDDSGLLSRLGTMNSNLTEQTGNVVKAVSDSAYDDAAMLDRLDTITDLLTTQNYLCSFSKDPNGNPYPIVTLPYDSACQIVARLNSTMQGRDITYIRKDGVSTYTYTFINAKLSASGYILVRGQYSNGSMDTAYLCDKAHNIFVSDPQLNYTPAIAAVTSRVGDVVNALGKLDTVDSNITLQAENIVHAISEASYDDSKLDTIIDLLQQNLSTDPAAHDHEFTRKVAHEAGCSVPGLVTYMCECGYGYSEVIPSLGHDWVFSEHVDEDSETGYDVYICSRCERVERDYDGSGAPTSGATGSIGELLASIFARLGKFFGDLLGGIFTLLDKLLTGFDNIVSDFNEKAQQISSFGGDYPTWLSGFWDVMPSDLQLAMSFCLVVFLVGVIGKRLVFKPS